MIELGQKLVPMLSLPIEHPELMRLAIVDNYVFSPKLDGDRCLIESDRGQFRALGRDGQVIDLPGPVLQCLAALPKGARIVLDGELMKSGNLWVFDLPYMDLDAIKIPLQCPYEERFAVLRALGRGLGWNEQGIPLHVLPDARLAVEKMTLLHDVLVNDQEGIVAKKLDSPYEPGKRSPYSLKWKVVKTVDCVVMDVNILGKANLLLGCYDGGVLKPVGKVSALTGDGPRCKIGDVVEVQYRSYFHSLYNATMPRLRPDKPGPECTIDQLISINRHDIEGGPEWPRKAQ